MSRASSEVVGTASVSTVYAVTPLFTSRTFQNLGCAFEQHAENTNGKTATTARDSKRLIGKTRIMPPIPKNVHLSKTVFPLP